jgi:hypothetical protein
MAGGDHTTRHRKILYCLEVEASEIRTFQAFHLLVQVFASHCVRSILDHSQMVWFGGPLDLVHRTQIAPVVDSNNGIAAGISLLTKSVGSR